MPPWGRSLPQQCADFRDRVDARLVAARERDEVERRAAGLDEGRDELGDVVRRAVRDVGLEFVAITRREV